MESIINANPLKNSSDKIIFDAERSESTTSQPITVKRAKELELTLGKVLLERFQKEIEAGNLGNKK